jgi:hypothetical protein
MPTTHYHQDAKDASFVSGLTSPLEELGSPLTPRERKDDDAMDDPLDNVNDEEPLLLFDSSEHSSEERIQVHCARVATNGHYRAVSSRLGIETTFCTRTIRVRMGNVNNNNNGHRKNNPVVVSSLLYSTPTQFDLDSKETKTDPDSISDACLFNTAETTNRKSGNSKKPIVSKSTITAMPLSPQTPSKRGQRIALQGQEYFSESSNFARGVSKVCKLLAIHVRIPCMVTSIVLNLARCDS